MSIITNIYDALDAKTGKIKWDWQNNYSNRML